MKIITWNINGLRSAIEKGDFYKLFLDNTDVVCLQEVKVSDENYIKSILPNGYFLTLNCAERKGYSGVAVFSKLQPINIKKSIGIQRFDQEGRCLILEFDNFVLYNIYIPHGGRDKKNLEYKIDVCDKIIEKLKKCISYNQKIIVTTDFNIAHNDIDLARPKQNTSNIMYTERERAIINRLLDIGMIDSFRNINKNENCYTWWPYAFNARERNIGWRIDYIFLSNNIKDYIKNVNILTNIYGSDHCPLEIILNEF